jgi:hypothetical protein
VTDEDGSVDIDIEILIAQVNESWHRLRHYKIKVSYSIKPNLLSILIHLAL